MRRLAQVGLTVAVAALLACPALAQQQQRQGRGGGRGMAGGGGALFLLRDKGIQQELKLTDDQVKTVSEAAKKQTELLQGGAGGNQQELRQKMQEINKSVETTLKPDQKKRLDQLVLQQRGLSALAVRGNQRNPNAQANTLAKDLKITDDQQKQINDIVAAQGEKMRDLAQNAGGNREEMAKKRAELTKATTQKIDGVLTAEQKTKWKEMTGEPYKGTFPSLFGGPGGRRQGGQGGRGAPPPA